MEKFDPQQYENELAELDGNGPYVVWSGKPYWRNEPEFPPQWGQPGGTADSIFRALVNWIDLLGSFRHLETVVNPTDEPYVVDKDGEIVLSLASSLDLAFLKWLADDQVTSGGTVGLLERHGLSYD